MERVRLFLAECGAETEREPSRDAGAAAGLTVARVFVTGASGFIGGALATRLLARGDQVVGLARSDAAAEKVAARGAEIARGDLLDEESITAGMAGCETAYHVAGMNSHCPADPEMMLRVNVGGAAAAVRAAAKAGIRRMVYTSSAAALGEPLGTVGTEDCAHRGSYLSVYDRSKHEGEQAVFAAAAETGVEVVAVNPSSVQGPPRTGGNGGDHHRLPQRQAARLRGHPRERGGRRGLRRGPPACRRARRERPALRAQRRHPPPRSRRSRSSPSCPACATASG